MKEHYILEFDRSENIRRFNANRNREIKPREETD